MNNTIAKLISGLTSPYLMVVVFGLWAVSASVNSTFVFLLYGGLCLACVLLLPLTYIVVQILRGQITDIHIAVREQRAEPFIIATIGALLLSILYIVLDAPRPLLAIAISLVVSGTIFGIITNYWKISVHAAAFTGSVVIVGYIISPQLLWLLLVLPIIVWARLTRNRHTITQVLLAAALNGCCVALTLTLLL